MDAFFAAIEQKDNPSLRGKPVIVGGSPKSRGVVSTCSYEARKFGIHSAMSCAKAHRLCPQAIFIRPRMERYKEISQIIRQIFYRYSDTIEPLSIDEAFLDVTHDKQKIGSATETARKIREEILQTTGLSSSAGVSYNKFLAKIGSDENKPGGITVITPDKALEFIHRLPIRKFYGVGKVTAEKMYRLNIKTGADLSRFEQRDLINLFGKSGIFFYNIARGIDNRPVCARRGSKSIGSETTLPRDITDMKSINDILQRLSQKIENSLKQKNICGKTLTLKVRYHDFNTITRSITSKRGFSRKEDIMSKVPQLLSATETGRKAVRLLGITVSNFPTGHGRKEFYQLLLPFMLNKR